MSSLTTRIAAVVATVVAALLLPSCSSSSPASENHPHPTDTDKPVVTGEPAGYNADDVAFANNMISRDRQGINMSRLVPDRSINPEVVAFAAASASALQSDIDILKVLLVQWDGDPDTKTGGDGHDATMKGMIDSATIAKLDSSRGSEFDTLWLESMSGLDLGAIEMANAEIINGKNVDAVGLARQIGKARQADIDQMKRILGG